MLSSSSVWSVFTKAQENEAVIFTEAMPVAGKAIMSCEPGQPPVKQREQSSTVCVPQTDSDTPDLIGEILENEDSQPGVRACMNYLTNVCCFTSFRAGVSN